MYASLQTARCFQSKFLTKLHFYMFINPLFDWCLYESSEVAFGFNFLVLFVSMDFIQSYITQFVSMGDFFSFLSDC